MISFISKARRCDFDRVYSTGFSPPLENPQRLSSLLWKSKPRSMCAVKLMALGAMPSHSPVCPLLSGHDLDENTCLTFIILMLYTFLT